MQNYANIQELLLSEPFSPAFGLSNAHIQTILASSVLRLQLVRHQAKPLLKASESILLHSTQGIRLRVDISKPKAPQGKMALVFHGWEGSADSAYALSCGQQLFAQGYTVCRINLRDHGDTHHLNKQPFNSVRLDEICDAIADLHQRFMPSNLLMLGFSLGGNFVLRLAGNAKLAGLPIKNSIAVCPAINPINSTNTIEQGAWFYHHYFVQKWQRSLRKKYQYFPEIMRTHKDLDKKRLWQMNRVFVPLHTEYDETEDYLNAYAITQATLDAIQHTCQIIYADDDPIIAASDFDNLTGTDWVDIQAVPHGGHCAFIQNYRLQNWFTQQLKLWFTAEQ